MPIRVDAERSPVPRQAVHGRADIHDRVDELEAQPVVTRWVRHALTNGELEEATDAIEVDVNA
jgi:hypothetical protein